MSNFNESKQEMLNYAVENGIIDLSCVQNMIEMKKREEILSKHPYRIWQGKNGSWYTYLLDEKETRKLIKKSSQDKIEQAVINYWREVEENPTIKDIFFEWLEKKLEREEISKSTVDRYIRQYNHCMGEFGSRKIRSIEEYDIEDFIIRAINEYSLTAKAFGNLRTLIFGIFKYAKKKKYITFSITDVMGDIEISKKAFKKVKKDPEELVFNESEMPQIIAYLEDNPTIINLAILLLFKTGMRVGELVALKPEDINVNIIHVNRTEICYYKGDKKIYEVRDFPKTEAGIRDIIVPESALWILKKIQLLNPFGEYVFMRGKERVKTYNIRTALQTACRRLNISQKSPNKIRKTYGSILIDSGADESLIISQMGHTDIKTTKGHYYKDRKTDKHKAEIINRIVDL